MEGGDGQGRRRKTDGVVEGCWEIGKFTCRDEAN